MNDEATVVIPAVVDQMTQGLQFLANTFNYKPSVAWQVFQPATMEERGGGKEGTTKDKQILKGKTTESNWRTV